MWYPRKRGSLAYTVVVGSGPTLSICSGTPLVNAQRSAPSPANQVLALFDSTPPRKCFLARMILTTIISIGAPTNAAKCIP